jgi:hypothetical protein
LLHLEIICLLWWLHLSVASGSSQIAKNGIPFFYFPLPCLLRREHNASRPSMRSFQFTYKRQAEKMVEPLDTKTEKTDQLICSRQEGSLICSLQRVIIFLPDGGLCFRRQEEHPFSSNALFCSECRKKMK